MEEEEASFWPAFEALPGVDDRLLARLGERFTAAKAHAVTRCVVRAYGTCVMQYGWERTASCVVLVWLQRRGALHAWAGLLCLARCSLGTGCRATVSAVWFTVADTQLVAPACRQPIICPG